MVFIPDTENEHCGSGQADNALRVLTMSSSASAESKGRACRELLACLPTHKSCTH